MAEKTYTIKIAADISESEPQVAILDKAIKTAGAEVIKVSESFDTLGRHVYSVMTTSIKAVEEASKAFDELDKKVDKGTRTRTVTSTPSKYWKDVKKEQDAYTQTARKDYETFWKESLKEQDAAIKKQAALDKEKVARKLSIIDTAQAENDLKRLAQLKINEAVNSGNQIKALQLKAAEETRQLAVQTAKLVEAERLKGTGRQSWIKTTGNLDKIKAADTAARSEIQTNLAEEINKIKKLAAAEAELEKKVAEDKQKLISHAFSLNAQRDAIAKKADADAKKAEADAKILAAQKVSRLIEGTTEQEHKKEAQLRLDAAVRSGNQIKALQVKAAEDERKLSVATNKAIQTEYEKARTGQSLAKTTGNINTISQGDTTARAGIQTQLFADIKTIKDADKVLQDLEDERKLRAKQNELALEVSVARAKARAAQKKVDDLAMLQDAHNINNQIDLANKAANTRAKEQEQTRLSQFSQFLKEKEALLRADINTQKQITFSGSISINSANASAEKERLVALQDYQNRLARIESSVQGGTKSATGQQEVNKAMNDYLVILGNVEAKLKRELDFQNDLKKTEKDQISLFTQGLKNKESLLRADLEIQKQIEFNGLSSIQVARAKARRDSLQAEQTYQDQIKAIRSNIQVGSPSALGNSQAATARADLLNAQNLINTRLHAEEVTTKNLKDQETQRLTEFSTFLKEREALLRADIQVQRQIEISGVDSIEAHRARANRSRLAEEQRYNTQISGINATVRGGGSSVLGQEQITAGVTEYLAALQHIDAQLGVHERAVQRTSHGVETAHQSMWLRVVEVTAVYRLWTTAIQYGQKALMSIPETGIHFEGTVASLTAITGSVTLAHREMAFLKFEADRTGLGLDNLRESFRQFAASAKTSGETTKSVETLFGNINTMATTLHLSTDQVSGSFLALSQMYAKGKIQAEELIKQLSNSIPGAVPLMAKAYRAFGAEHGKIFKTAAEAQKALFKDMKMGLVFPADVLPYFGKEIDKLYGGEAFTHASTGLNANLGKLSTAWTVLTENMYKASSGAMLAVVQSVTAQVESLGGLMSNTTRVSQAFDYMGSYISNTMSVIKTAVEMTGLAALAAFTGGLLVLARTLGTLPMVFEGLVLGVTLLKKAVVTHPVLVFSAALAELVRRYTDFNDQTERRVKIEAQVKDKAWTSILQAAHPEEIKKKEFDAKLENYPRVKQAEEELQAVLASRTELEKRLSDRVWDNDKGKAQGEKDLKASTEAYRAALFNKSEAIRVAKEAIALEASAEKETKKLNDEGIQGTDKKKRIAELQTAIEKSKQERETEKKLLESDVRYSLESGLKAPKFDEAGKNGGRRPLTYNQFVAKQDLKTLQSELQVQKEILKITGEIADSKDAVGKQENVIAALQSRILLIGKEADVLDARDKRILESDIKKLKAKSEREKGNTKEADFLDLQISQEGEIFAAQEKRQFALLPALREQHTLAQKKLTLTEDAGVVENRKLKLEADSFSISTLSVTLSKLENDYKAQSLELLKKNNTEGQKYLDVIYKQHQAEAVLADTERKSSEAAAFLQLAEKDLNDKKTAGLISEKQYLEEIKKARETQLPNLEAQLRIAEASTQEEGKKLRILQLQEQINSIKEPNKNAGANYLEQQGAAADPTDTRGYLSREANLAQGQQTDTSLLTQPGQMDKDGQLQTHETFLQQKSTLDSKYADANFINQSRYYAGIAGVGADTFKGITSHMIAMYGAQSKQAKIAFIAYKAFMVAQTIMNTAAGVVAQLTNPTPYVGIALAAVAAAMGAIQVAKIIAEPMPQAHGGLEYVPEDATYKLSKGERVLAPRQNEAFMKLNQDLSAQMQRESIGSSKSSVNATIVKPQIRVVNIDYSSSELSRHMQSAAGEEIVVNHMIRNRESLA